MWAPRPSLICRLRTRRFGSASRAFCVTLTPNLANFSSCRYAPSYPALLSGGRRTWDRLGRRLHALGRDAIELCRHDEVVLVQTLDLLGVQRDRGVAPAKPDLGMMSLGFGECGCALDEGEGLAEILETVGPLDPLCFVDQIPIRRLPAVAGSLLLC